MKQFLQVLIPLCFFNLSLGCGKPAVDMKRNDPDHLLLKLTSSALSRPRASNSVRLQQLDEFIEARRSKEIYVDIVYPDGGDDTYRISCTDIKVSRGYVIFHTSVGYFRFAADGRVQSFLNTESESREYIFPDGLQRIHFQGHPKSTHGGLLYSSGIPPNNRRPTDDDKNWLMQPLSSERIGDEIISRIKIQFSDDFAGHLVRWHIPYYH